MDHWVAEWMDHWMAEWMSHSVVRWVRPAPSRAAATATGAENPVLEAAGSAMDVDESQPVAGRVDQPLGG